MRKSTSLSNPFWDFGGSSEIQDSHLKNTEMQRWKGSGIFGNWTKKDEATYNQYQAAAQYYAQLSLMDYENEYNSPAHQAELMRQAGLNPDLQQIGFQSSAGANPTAPVSPAGGQPMEPIMNAVSIFSTAMNVATGLANGITDIVGKVAKNDLANLEVAAKADELASGYALNFAPPMLSTLSEEVDGENVLNPATIMSAFPFDTSGLNRRNRKRIEDLYLRHKKSPTTIAKRYGLKKQTESDRMEVGKIMSDPRYGASDEEIMKAWQPYTEAMADMLKAELGSKTARHNADNKKASNDLAYENRVDEIGLPEQRADAEQSDLTLRQSNNELMSRLRAPLYKVAENLENLAKQGKQWASYALIGLYTALSSSFSVGASGGNASFSLGL